MIVVSDSTPINILVRIEMVWVLPKIYGEVRIPPAVRTELSHAHTPEAVRSFVQSQPAWLIEQKPGRLLSLPHLDIGEVEAISLAAEIGAGTVLMDEWKGRRAASAAGLRVIGTIGVLEIAAIQSLVSFAEAVERLRSTDFHINPIILDEALDRDARRRGGRP